jgi:hypothetical protein
LWQQQHPQRIQKLAVDKFVVLVVAVEVVEFVEVPFAV